MIYFVVTLSSKTTIQTSRNPSCLDPLILQVVILHRLIALELFSQFTEERNLNLAKFPLCTFYACLLLMYYNTWCVCVVYFPGLGCSKLSLDNTGLVWNLISGLKALKKMQFKSFFMQFDQIVCLSKRLLNKGIKKPGLKSFEQWQQTEFVVIYLLVLFTLFFIYFFEVGGGGGRTWKERNRGCDILYIPSVEETKKITVDKKPEGYRFREPKLVCNAYLEQ